MIVMMLPIYVALWIIAAHIQFLMRNEKRQDKLWILACQCRKDRENLYGAL